MGPDTLHIDWIIGNWIVAIIIWIAAVMMIVLLLRRFVIHMRRVNTFLDVINGMNIRRPRGRFKDEYDLESSTKKQLEWEVSNRE